VTEPEGEDRKSGGTPSRSDRTELLSTSIALIWVSIVALLDAVFGGKFGLIGFLAIGPFIAAAFSGARRTALVGLYATFFSAILSTPPRQYGQLNHVLRVLTLVASTGVAVWISYLRTQRSLQLRSARSEMRVERRRRVAAETAQSMQALARALTTSADPAQVADAVFGALRDELDVDAATFATTDDRGVLGVHRRFGYQEGESERALLAALEPAGELGDVLLTRAAFFGDSIVRRRPGALTATAPAGPNRFDSLAVVPLVVSDHAVGAVVVQWVARRSISEADKSFLFTITGAAAQAVERARLTLTEFSNLERNQHLHHLSSALAAATTPGDVAREAIAGGRRALGAQSAACRLPVAGQRSLSCLATSGHPSLLSRQRVPMDHSLSGASFTSGRTIVTTLAATVDGDGESPEMELRAMVELGQPVTIVAEPLMGSAGPLGVLSLAFVARPEPSEPELRFLSTLAGLTAQALERAQLFEQERQARREAESGRARLSLLSDITKLLSSSLDPTTVMRRTMTLVVGRLADACAVQVPGENGLQRLTVQGSTIFASTAAQHLICPDTLSFDSDAPAAVAFRTGRPQLAAMTSPVAPVDGADDTTAFAVPFTTRGEVVGVMTFFDGPGRQLEADDVALAAEVASRTGVALSNATRYQREHVVAEVLQRAVLPDSLPTVPGLRFDAEYRAGAAGTYVGGDWYDVFELDDEHVVFSVGDVMGKGAPAAALMGQVRTAIRAYAVAGQSPAEVLSSLDRLFDALVENRVVTVVVGTINPSSGAMQLANAGHPSPLIVHANGTTTFPSTESSLLIAAGLGGPERPARDLQLHSGDSLVMYSDGLVERRGELITVGMQRLADTAASIASNGWPEKVAAVLATRLGDDERADDVVVLALHYLGPPVRDRESAHLGTGVSGMPTLRLDPVVESTPRARHWVTAQLLDVPSDVTECAALLTSELVTNAVLHAATPFTVTLHLMADRIRVDVADGSTVVPSMKDYATDAATGRGLTLFNTLASNWGVQLVAGGKIVWFEIPVDYAVMPAGISDGAFRFDLIGVAKAERHQTVDHEPPVDVELLGIPVAQLQKASEEYEALFRELRLMKEHSAAGDSASAPLPDRLAALLSEIGTRFNGFGPGMDENWQEVVEGRVERFDWRFSLPKSAAPACEVYDAMLDDADEFGQVARLLTLPASAASVAVRRWFLSELIGQLKGRQPISWEDSAFHRQLTERMAPT
jgi:serine phosphatase RsbU (regulator of sigma subunit)/transcriptional regulator with GAF, ATPase, and Fis domain/anti-sigma regulatory factor (Ser/Thr protein kinase)